MYSLKRQLHRNLLITVTVSMTVLFTALYHGIQKLTQEYVVSRLLHDADSIVAGLELKSGNQWQLPQDKMSGIYHRVHSGHYYLIVVNDQTIRSRSLFDFVVTLPSKIDRKKACYSTSVSERNIWLACLQQVKKEGTTLSIWVAEDISSLEKTQRQFLLFAIGAVIFTIFILLLTQYFILKRGFNQLDKVREAIKQLHHGSKEISSITSPIEIMPLVEEINRLLTHLSQRVRRSRNALGNLAHELKRPLQRFRWQLDRLNPEQRLEGDSVLQDIQNVVERELKRARIVGVATPGRHTVVNEDLIHLIEVMRSIYPDKHIETKYQENLILPHDRDDILELLGNLLDNACKYAKKRILICLEVVEHGWLITIEDDGNGVTPDALKIISDRGVRLDESVQGHGLGLSICKDIVESYSGETIFETAKLGGLAVIIAFPKFD